MSSRVKSVVLLSSGLDSSVNLFEAKLASEIVLALTFHYGQRSAEREIHFAKLQSEALSIPHKVIELPWFADFTTTSLVNRWTEVPFNVNILNASEIVESAKQVWVPNRNGIFLNVAAAYAESLNAHWIVPGFNREEATTFPDNSEGFIEAATKSLDFSTQNHVQVKCFTSHLDKPAIAKRGKELGVNFDLIWPCYLGNDRPCGQCESCLRFKRALS